MQAEELLYLAHSKQASDIHITVNSPVIFRIHGELRPINDTLLKPNDTLELAKQFMTEERYETLQQNGDVDFSYGVAGLARFRINAYKQRGSVGLAIRIVPSVIPTMEELRLPRIAAEFAKKPQGLLLVTGPTGSGKSTTLASIIDHMNRTENSHIITLEDPIEFIYDHKKSMVNQREVGLDTPSFSHGLRSALRQDPDIILVGELRDLETISTAISAAETGHLVFGTLHTADAPQTIDRIIDVFPPAMQAQIRIQLAAVLLGVISQRLLPRADGKGRTAAFEVLVNTPAVANLIRVEKIYQIRSVMQTGKALGMQTMEYALRELVQQGTVKIQDARDAVFGFGEL
ncbi:type IV pili twitching motility protein PilT [Paenibacillus sp. FSL H8-0548]|uniref:type IV pilus twitching motility protein PilT n=1 Tax=Paenibacillus sp. FSL H8-0548 TaxID=1920422 RepID=UPI00096F0BB5|nr:type IV pilus twitching motility protein PilT [Paenibacillus sp. FSL H8-0548]OMF21449.1 type IV pili twitching motility protein PilT [Paenibacillus sp. FSL H8-0548]